MFHHVKELQYNARVSKPDVRFAKLLLEQFGGPNGELRAALESIALNFEPSKLQSDPRYSNKYFNISKGEDATGTWNQGESPELGEQWKVIEETLHHVHATNGLLNEKPVGTKRTENSVQQANKKLSVQRKAEMDKATALKDGILSWSIYETDDEMPRKDSPR